MRIGPLTGFVAALLVSLAAFGQPVLADVVASGEECCSVAPSGAVDDVGTAFLHTADEFVDSIMDTGLRPGSYATPVEGLSPLQAHIELALPPGGGARNSVLTVDLAGLRSAGYEIPEVTRVSGAFGMPGGGYEMQFPYAIPPEFLSVG